MTARMMRGTYISRYVYLWDLGGKEVGDLGHRCYLQRGSNDKNKVYESFVVIDKPFTEFIREVFSKECYVGLTDVSADLVSRIGNIAKDTFITPAPAVSESSSSVLSS